MLELSERGQSSPRSRYVIILEHGGEGEDGGYI